MIKIKRRIGQNGRLPGSLKKAALSIFCVILLFISVGCNNDEQDSPYADILSRPPYSSLTDSIKLQPKNDDLYFRRAVLLNKNNFPEPALADFQKAWSISKQEKYAFGVTNALMEKRPDTAIVFLNEALKELPKSLLLRLSLARSYDAMNRTEEALAVCEALLQSAPGQPDFLVLQSDLLEKKGDTLASVAPLEKAYSLVPRNFTLGFKLAYKYAETKNKKTVGLCDSLITLDSLRLYPEPYYIKGIYYSNINNKAKAILHFDETIKHSYNYLSAYIEKGKVLIEQKKIGDAYGVFKLANTIKPSYPDAWYWMGVCHEALKQIEEARLNYEKAYALDKTFTEAKEAVERLGKL